MKMYLIPKEFLLLLLLVVTKSHSSTPNCSSVLYTRAGNISLPPKTQNCEWRIIANPDEKIILNITSLQTEKSPNCAYGYVEVREGFWRTSPLLEKFCGNGPLNPILASGGQMLLSYVNNRNYGSYNFTATYEAICGGILFVDSVTNFTTPNYPEFYPNNKKCIWWIMVPDSYTAIINFNSFDVEYYSSCVYDNVEVRDGLTLDSRLLGRYCNFRSPFQIVASSNKLLVKFESDSSVSRIGFSATVTAEINECTTGRHNCAHNCVNTIGSYYCTCRVGYELLPNGRDCGAGCGGTITTPTGTIASPWYPQSYPPNRTCIWDIIPPPHHSVVLSFNHFDIEGTSPQNCPKDKLETYVASGTDPLLSSSSFCRNTSTTPQDFFHLLGTRCGIVVPNTVTYRGSKVRLVFTSDATVQKTGFSASYYTTLDGCSVNNGNCQTCSNSTGRTQCYCDPRKNLTALPNDQGCFDGDCKYQIRTQSGRFSSPNYPNAYPNNKNCQWNFTTTPGHRLNVTFSAFELERRGETGYDYVSFSNAYPSSSVIFYNSMQLPPPVVSLDNKLTMNFFSDSYNEGTWIGFSGNYRSICGGNFTASATKQYIYSHVGYGHTPYDNNVLCEWNIVAPAGKFVTAAFEDWDLENCCGCDYVEILNQNISGTSRYCYQNKPQRICSSGNNLLIRFRTDGSVVKRGFSLVYKSTD